MNEGREGEREVGMGEQEGRRVEGGMEGERGRRREGERERGGEGQRERGGGREGKGRREESEGGDRRREQNSLFLCAPYSAMNNY